MWVPGVFTVVSVLFVMSCSDADETTRNFAGANYHPALDQCRDIANHQFITDEEAHTRDAWFADPTLDSLLGSDFSAVTFASRDIFIEICAWLEQLASNAIQARIDALKMENQTQQIYAQRIETNRDMLATIIQGVWSSPEWFRGVKASSGKLQTAGTVDTFTFFPGVSLIWNHLVTRPSNLPGLEGLVEDVRVHAAGTATAVVIARNVESKGAVIMKPHEGTEALFEPLHFRPYSSSWYILDRADAAQLIKDWRAGTTPQQRRACGSQSELPAH